MATGYTHKIAEQDVSAREFILDCSRAFGAHVMSRDSNGPAPESYPISDYHEKRLAEAEQELDDLRMMSKKQISEFSKKSHKERRESYDAAIAKMNALMTKYDKLITEVTEWLIPTEEHRGLKDFCLQQLIDSKQHDCDIEYYANALKSLEAEISLDPIMPYKSALKAALENIEYHKKESIKEVKRDTGRNDWIRQLHESLPEKV